jgi:hypothetical protein
MLQAQRGGTAERGPGTAELCAYREEGVVSSLSIFIIGFLILIGGLAYGASMAGLSPQWIAVGVAVLAGIGIVMGVTKTRMRDPSHD